MILFKVKIHQDLKLELYGFLLLIFYILFLYLKKD